jgi:hypothetical protein
MKTVPAVRYRSSFPVRMANSRTQKRGSDKTPTPKSEMAKPRTRTFEGTVRREVVFIKVKMINKFREVAIKDIKASITIIDIVHEVTILIARQSTKSLHYWKLRSRRHLLLL